MADVASTLAGWSSTSNSNSPAGSATIGTGLAPNLREIQGVIVRGLSHKGSDIASVAGTTDIGAVEGSFHDITGALAITGLGTVRAGIHKWLKFEGAATLTHNATALILPGAANIVCADGDVGLFISEGSGNWRCLSFVKASGLPVVALTQSGLASGSVGQAQLKTTTASGSVAVNTVSSASYALTGGTYSWWTAGANQVTMGFGVGDTAAGTIGISNSNGSNGTAFFDERYVQASPPYNLGNGDIPLFVFVLLNPDGTVAGHSVGRDPTWAYHGPTTITAQRAENGKSYRRYKFVGDVMLADYIASPEGKTNILGGAVEAVEREIEITQDIKNKDIAIFPHPFGRQLLGRTVAMFDPFSPLVSKLDMLADHISAVEMMDLLSRSVTVDPDPVSGLIVPPRVRGCRAKLK